jgi:hypothetical protein
MLAIDEPHFCEVYANMCKVLYMSMQAQAENKNKNEPEFSFKMILLTGCMAEFGKRFEAQLN